jgi:hypothetical protein
MDEANRSQIAVNRGRDIPSISLFPVQDRTFNFHFTGIVDNYNFSPRDFCAMIGIANPGLVSTDVYPAMATVRINRIELWSGPVPVTSNTPSANIWVTRTLTDGQPQRLLGNVRQDVQVPGMTVVPHLVLSRTQKANSVLNQWYEQDDREYLVGCSAGTGSIMQVHVSYTLNLYQQNAANVLSTTSYLSALGRPVLGLSALDSGNVSGSRLVVPVQQSASTSAQIPIFD